MLEAPCFQKFLSWGTKALRCWKKGSETLLLPEHMWDLRLVAGKRGKKPLSPQERDRHRSWPCYRLQVPFKEMKPQSLWPCLLVTPLPPPWPVGAAPALLEKECHPFLSRPPYNLFRMQIRHPASDPTEDQIGSPLASHAGVWRLLQSESGSFFFFF